MAPAPPTLTQIANRACLSSGEAIHVHGERLASTRLFQLVLVSSEGQSVLAVDRWSENRITASLPQRPIPLDGQAVLILQDRSTGKFASNRLVITLCPPPARDPQHSRTNTSASSSDIIHQQPSPQKPPARESTAPAGMLIPSEDAVPLAASDNESDIEAGELILFSDDMAAARQLDQQLQKLGHSIKRRRTLKQLGLVISTIRLAEGVSVQDGRKQLQQLDPQLLIDANHRYRLSERESAQTDTAHALMKWNPTTADCGKGLRLGLVDTLIDTSHPSLASAAIVSHSLLPLGMKVAGRRHATAIASILLGQSNNVNGITGLLPGAQLYNAGIFRQRDDDEVDTTAELIISALNWMQEQQVSVINISLAGSPNRLLQWVVESLLKQNQLLTAAAGNAGPDAPPAYPAAWPGVVGVTAVDQQARIYRHANRGSYIDLAAPGVDLWAARPGAPGAYYTGTSYAVPYATAALAILKQNNPDMNGAELRQALQKTARDLGPPGRDPIFGYGLLQLPDGCG